MTCYMRILGMPLITPFERVSLNWWRFLKFVRI